VPKESLKTTSRTKKIKKLPKKIKKITRVGNRYDTIVIGAGSIGVPVALSLAQAGERVLVVDKGASVGQGENKHAIGGIRATHSDRSKIITAMRSLEIVSSWQGLYGDDIEWIEGGYLFVVYNKDHEKMLKGLLKYQKSYGLVIDWVAPDKVTELAPGINQKGLRGGIYSPYDGNMSPLLLINAYARRSLVAGVEFKFNETVTGITKTKNAVTGVRTDKGKYTCDYVVNAAGAYAREVAALANIDVPIMPESHEAGITEPVKRFFDPMVVDMRPAPGSKNYYFYQNALGQIVFCITPQPPILGTDIRSTSVFLPQIGKRMVDLLPRLQYIKVRRCWRGLYPMTPDAQPIVDEVRDLNGFVIAGGMCGQGLMLGPGLGELIGRLIVNKLTAQDKEVLKGFSLYRDFSKSEVFK
ncbi:NAD(P)/FAD-dependent oxidoreductase, partial [[Eubacterium] cellulosolvens]